MADCNNNLFVEPLKPSDLAKSADLPETAELIRNIELSEPAEPSKPNGLPDELARSSGLPDEAVEATCPSEAADQPIDLPEPIDLCYTRHVPSTGIDRTKTPILIQHGIFSNKESWAVLGKKIADETRRAVYCIDARDHGGRS